tara:strand:- start:1325 stop:2347 length:1023 start_codon:yes stop_codon:yes gene_type:complete
MSFKRFDQEDVVVSAESVTSPVWTGDQVTLTGFFTSSTQTGGNSGDYFYDIYQTGSNLTGARVQFSTAYGDKKGSGSLLFNDNVTGKSPSSTIYGQYRTLVLGDEDADFSFGGVSSEHFYVLNIDRANYKEKLLPGTLDLVLGISGSSRRLNITDNSKAVTTTTFNDAGRVYQLVSGSLGTVNTSVQNTGYTNGSGSYGFLLPDVGVILLNGKALDGNIADGGLALGSNRSNNVAGLNQRLIYNYLRDGSSFRIQSEETIASNFVFVRARNAEFNYSTNPSLITGSGELRYNVMINSPQSYVTTVGLYNDNNDLLAVAKLSRPLLKDFNKEALIRIKLDY